MCGDEGRCVVYNLRKEVCSLIADYCDGDRHEIKRDSRWLAIGVARVPSVWPARSYCAQVHGVIPSGIRWGAGAIFCSAPAAPSAQGKQQGSSWCWRGRIFRGWRIFAVHFCSTAAPGFEEQSRVLRIGVRSSGSTTNCAGGREFHPVSYTHLTLPTKRIV